LHYLSQCGLWEGIQWADLVDVSGYEAGCQVNQRRDLETTRRGTDVHYGGARKGKEKLHRNTHSISVLQVVLQAVLKASF